ncbi:terpene synthase family protein [Micromonospora sp. NPDC003197]
MSGNLPLVNERDELAVAAEQGQICALAATGQRDLQKCAERHPELFSGNPFDPALFGTVALAMAFSAPWCTPGQLRVATRAVLWGFAADWQIDYLAKSADEVDDLVADCLSVADGATDIAHPLGRFLADIRDELTAAPGFGELRPVWREELHRMLAGMAREWRWRTAKSDDDLTEPLPSFAEYLANADNLGASFVNVSHWVNTGTPATARHLVELTGASAEAQRALRLINDLATYERDVNWGDLNALMLVDRAEVTREITRYVDRCRELLSPLADECPRESAFLTRQLGFASGFYQVTDFWGSL